MWGRTRHWLGVAAALFAAASCDGARRAPRPPTIVGTGGTPASGGSSYIPPASLELEIETPPRATGGVCADGAPARGHYGSCDDAPWKEECIVTTPLPLCSGAELESLGGFGGSNGLAGGSGEGGGALGGFGGEGTPSVPAEACPLYFDRDPCLDAVCVVHARLLATGEIECCYDMRTLHTCF